MLGLAILAAGAAWLIRANSGTAKDACLHNLKQIDAAIQHWETNAQQTITTRTNTLQ